jgi:hypothetical protein
MYETSTTDFVKETTATAIHIHPKTAKAIQYVAQLEAGFYWKYYNPTDDTITFKLPAEKPDAANFLEHLVEAGYSVGVI